MLRSYIDHLNEKIEALYIALSSVQINGNSIGSSGVGGNSSSIASSNNHSADQLFKIIRDIEQYKHSHNKYLEGRNQADNSSNHHQIRTDDLVNNTTSVDEYTLVNDVLNDCYKKCATYIRSPYTDQIRSLISSSRKKLQMKASQGDSDVDDDVHCMILRMIYEHYCHIDECYCSELHVCSKTANDKYLSIVIYLCIS